MLTKDEILAAADRPVETAAVPEWGGEVSLRVMSAAMRDEFERLQFEGRDRQERLANIRATLVSFCLAGPDGERLFGPDEVKALGEKSAKALDRLFWRCRKLNALGDADIEDLEKNSSGGRDGASPSPSP